jgi:hypothetical protein
MMRKLNAGSVQTFRALVQMCEIPRYGIRLNEMPRGESGKTLEFPLGYQTAVPIPLFPSLDENATSYWGHAANAQRLRRFRRERIPLTS